MTNELINDFLRNIISAGARLCGALMTAAEPVRTRSFRKQQRRLRQKYKITDDTPILSYGAELAKLIQAKATEQPSNVRVAITSGSTSSPKRVLFTKGRLRSVKLTFITFFVRCCSNFSIKRTSLYLFSSFHNDESLTSMLLEERRLPWYFSTLQAPYRVQSHLAVKLLASQYGAAAVRLWILTLSNPGVLYSTNPSTISTFFDELTSNWQLTSQLVRDWHNKSDTFSAAVHGIAKRIGSRGSHARCARIAEATTPVPLKEYAPAVDTYICWTGGYVQVFLERLGSHLPTSQYRLIPMYSMSTEAIETIGHFRGSELSFLPTADGVLYEFVDSNPAKAGGELLEPHQLKPGNSYSMIVSDDYGLSRYDTGDVFLCRRKVYDLPDLIFMRRRNLEYSFTGEKLTAEQLCVAFDELRKKADLASDIFLTCIPSQPFSDRIPHYKIVALSEQLNGRGDCFEGLQQDCDRRLAELNCEYKAKRETGRLGPVRLVRMNRIDFINLTTNCQSESWEAQYKFLPLYIQTWEMMNERK